MRVLVCGGRSFDDYGLLSAELDRLHAQHGFTLVIHGAARGADLMAGDWAHNLLLPIRAFRADWKKHGNSAGPIRNKQMLDEGKPQLVIAFKGGNGTRNMVEQAERAGVKVEKIGW